MTTACALRRWQGRAGIDRRAAELLHEADDIGALAESLTSAISATSGDAFLIVRAGPWASGAWDRVSKCLPPASSNTRFCFAVDQHALAGIGTSATDTERMGFMLDRVDLDTPVAALICDRIEAVRFDPRFVARAARNLREGCALEAMLGLARDLGLCTLGADVVPGGASLDGRGEFDYLPVPDDDGGVSHAHRPATPLARTRHANRQIHFNR